MHKLLCSSPERQRKEEIADVCARLTEAFGTLRLVKGWKGKEEAGAHIQEMCTLEILSENQAQWYVLIIPELGWGMGDEGGKIRSLRSYSRTQLAGDQLDLHSNLYLKKMKVPSEEHGYNIEGCDSR